ncbi:ATP-binding cassette, subfamily C, LapB [Dyella sp. OK004]|uniref:type I secretion system permease/ATPase n=1 Tax=Dyella sp. OK004 TaxID=1855292 RepID=UPI0008F2BF89|nr:type I secretion system permease/ATPase [Dyella sp. OK004]SFR95190.1 ATP-binding cassette, subfamily C, LapB [Dyella sp. OK004]
MNSNAADSTTPKRLDLQARSAVVDTLLASLMWLCKHHQIDKSAQALKAGLPVGGMLEPSLALAALEQSGMSAAVVERKVAQISAHLWPVVLLRKDYGGCVLLSHRKTDDGVRYRVVLPELGDDAVEIDADEMDATYVGFAILAKPKAKVDHRAGAPEPERAGHWLISTLWRYRRYYGNAALATVLVNVLSLASIFFTMNVYDRVVPNYAVVTMWSLAIGVATAMIFEGLSRFIRSYILDIAGKKADLVMGSMLFRQALAIRMEYKPSSPGTFANQLREFDSVRDFVTSATLSAIADLPFVLLFVGVIFAVGGPLGWVPLLLIPIVIIVSVVVQWPLARIMNENLRETSLKQGVLIESIEGLETLKAVGGESFMQRRWDRFSALAAATSMKSRHLSGLATGLITFFQQIQTVAIVVIGVYLIEAKELTQGSLIATVMLASRAIAPLNQVIGLAVRYQQAKVALKSMNQLMAMPTERNAEQDYLADHELSGQLQLQDVGFSYPVPMGQPAPPPMLSSISFTVAPGERVGIVGKVGSGKSTLLKVIARLYEPTDGQLLADGLNASQIDPADWRHAVGYVGQHSRLFYGTLRQNILIGRPSATAQEFLDVLRLTGLESIAARHPLGVNLPIGETGEGLSGGQRQLVALARALIARPKVLLLDEPASGMDAQTEARFVEQLKHVMHGQTLLLVTHRPSLLTLVDRVLVMDEGKVAIDGDKATVLAQLSAAQKVPTARALAQEDAA